MHKDCVFCHLELVPDQNILFSNEHCIFIQLDSVQIKGSILEGSGLIIPKQHRETAFDLTREEWDATYSLLHEVKAYIDESHKPQGYNLGWNCGDVAGQHVFHAHFHVIPRFEDEPLAGKGIRHLFKSNVNERKKSREMD
ncbi:HIT family protein [Bacillus suaedaesalsae]|uniref:HIT domain-containing protein n=1 Tax=Bacillus suaedaesalsae TaxID=2810349 RepID=A0ABS2DHN2_9BACI|nr:HIT domain-containing protein [Bacillus suaedaesalsae]MBM6617990.1 HIT domain-containing protein [Bacillus suaedaesalsae]